MIETTLQNNQLVPVALVSRPGIMQQSLRSSLASCQGIVVVASCGNGLTALHQVTKLRPALLVIDSNLLDEEVEALIAAVKVEQPTIGCLVVVRSSHQERQMLALGADAVVLRDEPSGKADAGSGRRCGGAARCSTATVSRGAGSAGQAARDPPA